MPGWVRSTRPRGLVSGDGSAPPAARRPCGLDRCAARRPRPRRSFAVVLYVTIRGIFRFAIPSFVAGGVASTAATANPQNAAAHLLLRAASAETPGRSLPAKPGHRLAACAPPDRAASLCHHVARCSGPRRPWRFHLLATWFCPRFVVSLFPACSLARRCAHEMRRLKFWILLDHVVFVCLRGAASLRPARRFAGCSTFLLSALPRFRVPIKPSRVGPHTSFAPLAHPITLAARMARDFRRRRFHAFLREKRSCRLAKKIRFFCSCRP